MHNKKVLSDIKPKNSVLVQTSKNNNLLAQKIKEASKKIMIKNYSLYKDLENK